MFSFLPSFTFLMELRGFTEDLWALWCLDQVSRYDIARGAMEVHTILPAGTLPAGGEGDACSAFLSSLF
jgi:hypothetical protein